MYAYMFKNAWFTYGVVCMRTLDFSIAIVCFRQNLRMDHDNAEVCTYVCLYICMYVKYVCMYVCMYVKYVYTCIISKKNGKKID